MEMLIEGDQYVFPFRSDCVLGARNYKMTIKIAIANYDWNVFIVS